MTVRRMVEIETDEHHQGTHLQRIVSGMVKHKPAMHVEIATLDPGASRQSHECPAAETRPTGIALLTVPTFAVSVTAMAYLPLFAAVLVLTYIGTLSGDQAEHMIYALAALLLGCSTAMGHAGSLRRALKRAMRAIPSTRRTDK
jgi:hypothetical protein